MVKLEFIIGRGNPNCSKPGETDASRAALNNRSKRNDTSFNKSRKKQSRPDRIRAEISVCK